jgi:hypothetical protein
VTTKRFDKSKAPDGNRKPDEVLSPSIQIDPAQAKLKKTELNRNRLLNPKMIVLAALLSILFFRLYYRHMGIHMDQAKTLAKSACVGQPASCARTVDKNFKPAFYIILHLRLVEVGREGNSMKRVSRHVLKSGETGKPQMIGRLTKINV